MTELIEVLTVFEEMPVEQREALKLAAEIVGGTYLDHARPSVQMVEPEGATMADALRSWITDLSSTGPFDIYMIRFRKVRHE